MKKVLLYFFSAAAMSDFILDYEVSNAEVNSRDFTLSAYLSHEQVEAACTYYGAFLDWQQIVVES